jgi:hypothetical protein
MKKGIKLNNEAEAIYNSFYWKLYPHTPNVAYVAKQTCLLHLSRIIELGQEIGSEDFINKWTTIRQIIIDDY